MALLKQTREPETPASLVTGCDLVVAMGVAGALHPAKTRTATHEAKIPVILRLTSTPHGNERNSTFNPFLVG